MAPRAIWKDFIYLVRPSDSLLTDRITVRCGRQNKKIHHAIDPRPLGCVCPSTVRGGSTPCSAFCHRWTATMVGKRAPNPPLPTIFLSSLQSTAKGQTSRRSFHSPKTRFRSGSMFSRIHQPNFHPTPDLRQRANKHTNHSPVQYARVFPMNVKRSKSR